MNITYELLCEHPKACYAQRWMFERLYPVALFPDGVEATLENIEAAERAGFDLYWLLRFKFPQLYDVWYAELSNQPYNDLRISDDTNNYCAWYGESIHQALLKVADL